MKSDVFNELESHFIATKKWISLDRAYVNFTHWTLVNGDPGSVPYQKNGFYVSWLRHNAYICQSCFPSINLVIPMAFPDDEGIITPECMSYIVISVKNRSAGSEGIEMNVLSKEAVEGVIAVKNNKKRKLHNPEVGDKGDCNVEVEKGDEKADARYTHCSESLNVRLTLHALKFINPGGVASVTDDDKRWIEPSEHKPYIAFAMSMGDTERKERLFIAEDVIPNTCLSYALG